MKYESGALLMSNSDGARNALRIPIARAEASCLGEAIRYCVAHEPHSEDCWKSVRIDSKSGNLVVFSEFDDQISITWGQDDEIAEWLAHDDELDERWAPPCEYIRHSEALDIAAELEAIADSPERLAVLSTPVVTADGTYTMESITAERAARLAAEADLDSAVGHEATAAILSTILGVNVPVCRQTLTQQVGQRALVFKLNDRRPEPGQELSRRELEEIGFSFKLLTRIA